MGIRKGHGKNKKSNRPATAIAVKRDEIVRRGAQDSAKPRRKGMR